MKYGFVLLGILILVVLASPTIGDTELELIDGRVLRGVEVTRSAGIYILRLEGGGEVALPEELVKQVRLIGSGEELSDVLPPEGPSGFRNDGPQTLAGVRVKAPRKSEQLKVLGESARFQQDIIDSHWEPSSDWDMDPENNNFAPSTWSKGVIDPTWEPESAFDADKDVLENSRSTWKKSVVDSTWKPTDGFAKR